MLKVELTDVPCTDMEDAVRKQLAEELGGDAENQRAVDGLCDALGFLVSDTAGALGYDANRKANLTAEATAVEGEDAKLTITLVFPAEKSDAAEPVEDEEEDDDSEGKT